MPIEIKNLVHTYSYNGLTETKAIKRANLTINEGEFIGIIGHTGSGKTTFVQHLNGLLLPTEGNVIIDGVDTKENKDNLKNIRKSVGLVFQYPETQLFEESVYKDIAFGPKNLGLNKDEVDERVRDAMFMVDLDFDEYSNRSPFELSGGQMRRVAIAGVIAMNPKYLVLDEPTAGLDPYGREKIINMIREYHINGNRTIIMVTHNMDEISKLASRLIIFNQGEIVEDDIPENIFIKQEKLNEIGLDVPQASQLVHKLNSVGINIPKNIYRIDDLQNHIIALCKDKGVL
ncbi:MAG: energy-coupling factor transporter ATPase [Christensenellaceae bacterium]|nr:energy-coupling factor transporter ATPase [Christensenellaceae bacterium]